MVDSGAGTTVIGPDDVRAVQASEPNPALNYKLADGSLIPHKGLKSFTAATEAGDLREINASVTDVDKPLLSVSQVVLSGATVVFSPKGSYIDCKGGNRTPLELQGNIYTLKMWVPKNQTSPFQGPA